MPGFRKSGHIWRLRKTLSHCFCDTDHPTTIYGDSGKLRRIVFVTLTIQQPYMADLGYYTVTGNFRVTQELVRYDIHFLSFILVK